MNAVFIRTAYAIPRILTTSGTIRIQLQLKKSLQSFAYKLPCAHFSSERQNKLLTVPNALTLTRIAAIPAIVYLIVNNQVVSASALTVIAGLTDIVRKALPLNSYILG